MMNTVRMTLAIGVIGFAFGVGTPIVRAEGAGACSADIQRLCPGIQPGEGRIAQCLKAHAADMSPACKQQIQEKMKEKGAAIKQACGADLEKFCASASGKGARMQCLKQNEGQLSAGCQSTLQSMKGHGQAGNEPPAPGGD